MDKTDSTITIPGWLFGSLVGLLLSAVTFVFSAGTSYRELTVAITQLEKLSAKQDSYDKDMSGLKMQNQKRDDDIQEINNKLDLILNGQLQGMGYKRGKKQ